MSSTIKRLENLNLLHKLIKAARTGSSTELSVKLSMSRRTVQAYLQELRDMGAIITYDEMYSTYVYENKFELTFIFEINVSSL